MNSPKRWILIGLLVAGAGAAWGFIPQSEQYSDWGGFSDEGVVDVNCGSAFSPDVDPEFRDYEEGQVYREDQRNGYDPPVFGGQTADQVCEDLTSGPRTVAIAATAGGALLALIGFVSAAGSTGTALPTASDESEGRSPSSAAQPPAPPPPPPPAPAAAAPSPAMSASLPSSQPAPPPPQMTLESVPSSTTQSNLPGLVSVTPPPVSPAFERTPALVFGDGRRVGLTDPVVIGRDPTAPADLTTSALVSVSDATVSKTHLLVGVTGEDVWIEDLHSSNGVSIQAPTGETIDAKPGQRLIIDTGDCVVVGDSTTFTISDGDGRSR